MKNYTFFWMFVREFLYPPPPSRLAVIVASPRKAGGDLLIALCVCSLFQWNSNNANHWNVSVVHDSEVVASLQISQCFVNLEPGRNVVLRVSCLYCVISTLSCCWSQKSLLYCHQSHVLVKGSILYLCQCFVGWVHVAGHLLLTFQRMYNSLIPDYVRSESAKDTLFDMGTIDREVVCI